MRHAITAVIVAVAAVAASGSAAAAQTVERTIICGTIKAYTPATASAAGSITIGTRTIAIAAGATTSNVNPAVQVGADSCVSGTLDGAGQFTEFGPGPWDTRYCGVVSAFTPASSTTEGSLTLGTTGRVTFRVPRGTSIDAVIGTRDHCFTIALDSAGDAIVTGVEGPAQFGVGGSPPKSLPSTSTGQQASDSQLLWIVGAISALTLASLRALRSRS